MPIIPSIAQLMRIPVSFMNLKTHALIDTVAAAIFLAHRLLIDIPYKYIKEITGPNKIEQLFKRYLIITKTLAKDLEISNQVTHRYPLRNRK